MKSHKGRAKRFRATKHSVKHRQANRSHMNHKMSSRRRRNLNKIGTVSHADLFRINRSIDLR